MSTAYNLLVETSPKPLKLSKNHSGKGHKGPKECEPWCLLLATTICTLHPHQVTTLAQPKTCWHRTLGSERVCNNLSGDGRLAASNFHLSHVMDPSSTSQGSQPLDHPHRSACMGVSKTSRAPIWTKSDYKERAPS